MKLIVANFDEYEEKKLSEKLIPYTQNRNDIFISISGKKAKEIKNTILVNKEQIFCLGLWGGEANDLTQFHINKSEITMLVNICNSFNVYYRMNYDTETVVNVPEGIFDNIINYAKFCGEDELKALEFVVHFHEIMYGGVKCPDNIESYIASQSKGMLKMEIIDPQKEKIESLKKAIDKTKLFAFSSRNNNLEIIKYDDRKERIKRYLESKFKTKNIGCLITNNDKEISLLNINDEKVNFNTMFLI